MYAMRCIIRVALAHGQKAFKHELAGRNDTGFSSPSKEVPKLVFVHHLCPD